MNDLDYLNQISASVAPKKSAAPFLDKKMKLILLIAAVVLVVVIILMTMTASAPKALEGDGELGRIYNRSTSLLKTIESYNKSVKSSSLRASGTTLQTVLTELETGSKSMLETYYGAKATDYALTASDSSLLEGTNSTLEKAELNGVLDRYYASELAYQIGHLIIVEDQAIAKNSNENIVVFLEGSKASLEQLEATFSSFSETD